MIDGISRRSLVAGGLITAGALGAAALAPRSAQAEQVATSYSTSLNNLPSFMTEVPAPVSDDELVATYDYDVVVVGAGITGLAATVAAHNAGVSVAVVQKQSMGVSQGSAGSGIDLENSDMAAVQHLVDVQISSNHYRPIREVVNTWAQKSGEAWNALIDFTKDTDYPLVVTKTEEVPYGDGLKATKFSCRPDGINYAGATPIWFDHVAESAADVYYETPATQLVQEEDGSVTGVICQNKDGYVRFNAAKGVILCAGDYQNDHEMVAYFLPDLANSPVTKQSGKTGDGIKMGFWAGGVIEPVHHTKMSHDFGSGPMASEPFLYVDGNGRRFCCEGVHLSLMSNFLRFSNSSTWFQIFDGNYEENVAGWGGEVTAAEDLAPFIPEEEDAYKGRGQVHRADTLEELADVLGIEDVETFLATVERYNELCEKGADDDFGKDPAYLKPVATPPFYGTQRDTGITAICAGLLTDGDQRVIDADGDPIPGLYAAGNTSGGFFGAIDYPFVGEYIDAISIGRCVSGGYAAAQHAASR